MTQVGHVQAAVKPRAGTSQQLWATQRKRHWDNSLACSAQPALKTARSESADLQGMEACNT